MNSINACEWPRCYEPAGTRLNVIREDGMIAVTPVAEELLRERLRRTEHELRVLTRMSRLIGQLRPLRETLDQIATQVAELLGAPFCAILLSSPADSLLTIEGAYGLDREYIAFINANRSMRLDTLLGLPSGEVFRTGQPQVWIDVRPAMIAISHPTS